jgi:hypothetical protein
MYARPARCAHEYRASIEPKPCPWSPSGAPAWRATQATKYAHQGAGPGLRAVAARYRAIRGELFDPGGCSACPTSPAAAVTMRAPTLLPAGAVAVVAIAPGRADAKRGAGRRRLRRGNGERTRY